MFVHRYLERLGNNSGSGTDGEMERLGGWTSARLADGERLAGTGGVVGADGALQDRLDVAPTSPTRVARPPVPYTHLVRRDRHALAHLNK